MKICHCLLMRHLGVHQRVREVYGLSTPLEGYISLGWLV